MHIPLALYGDLLDSMERVYSNRPSRYIRKHNFSFFWQFNCFKQSNLKFALIFLVLAEIREAFVFLKDMVVQKWLPERDFNFVKEWISLIFNYVMDIGEQKGLRLLYEGWFTIMGHYHLVPSILYVYEQSANQSNLKAQKEGDIWPPPWKNLTTWFDRP